MDINRRALLGRLATLGAGVGAAVWLRARYLHPKPQVIFTGPGDDSGWLALPAREPLIELTAQVHGLPIRTVVDSGAQFSAIDQLLAARFGLAESLLPMVAFGVSGEPSLTHMVRLDFAIGAMQVSGARAATLELAALSSSIGRPFSMLLGRDVLQTVVLDVDWPAERVRFVRPAAYRPPPGAIAVRARLENGALMVPIVIENAPPVEVMVDTGATAGIALSDTSGAAVGLLAGRPMTTGRSVSLGGLSEDRVVTARLVEFAGRPLHAVEVEIFKSSVHGPLPDGLIGGGVLRRFRLGLDLGAGALWLSPGASPLKRSR